MKELLHSQSGSAGNSVYAQLKQQIVSMELPPGTALSEKEMSVAFQVSRTPVRESFVRLAQEGLLLVLPQRGTRVSLIDPDLVEEARFMREQLERAVIRLACQSLPAEHLAAMDNNVEQQRESLQKHDEESMFALDEEYHRILFDGCRKLGTWSVIQQMNAHLNRTRIMWLKTDPHWDHLYEQHRQMAEAIRMQDENRADQIMQAHLTLSIASLSVLQEKFPHFFSAVK
ncbi:GntR family transcriptional regulator [Fontibacillus phaseoli]|uniref:GntR family transcriptional regulator n=1 Tax=Fontibacillus phaseoli TaxID=1416533 RepID=A0A369B5Z4_9BACL|nr:GntR family transcriptional regulator [Fontibacillus phaseoli]RCX16745.1 GntR family transcriptional regulator [Fontibacillus phaseoli]